MSGTQTLTRRLGLVVLGALLLGVLALFGWWYAIHWQPAASEYPLQGVDVSQDSGAIDWPVVRAGGADFAYVRATNGGAQRDANFAVNWAGTHAAGLRRGAIHVFSPCASAADQANNFIVTVPRVTDALPAAVAIGDGADCGTPPTRAALVAGLTEFAKIVETHTGTPLMLMISPAVEAQYDLARAFERPLWATRNYFAPKYLSRPWRMWRTNDARRIEGAERPVGWDVVAP